MRALRRVRPTVEVSAGERPLAWTALPDDQWVVGTRDALYLPGARLPWEQVQPAEWDPEADRLRVVEVGRWGEARRVHELDVPESSSRDADRLLQLVRERVTSSILVSRHVRVEGRRGVRVVGRRAPSGRSDVTWFYEYDAGVDPEDPFVRAAAETALGAAKSDVGAI